MFKLVVKHYSIQFDSKGGSTISFIVEQFKWGNKYS